jgi:hypothetical protein
MLVIFIFFNFVVRNFGDIYVFLCFNTAVIKTLLNYTSLTESRWLSEAHLL